METQTNTQTGLNVTFTKNTNDFFAATFVFDESDLSFDEFQDGWYLFFPEEPACYDNLEAEIIKLLNKAGISGFVIEGI